MSYVEMVNAQRVRVERQAGEVKPLWEAWELAREDAFDAYLDWWEAARADRADAYCAYLAAADREAASEDFLRANVHGVPTDAAA